MITGARAIQLAEALMPGCGQPVDRMIVVVSDIAIYLPMGDEKVPERRSTGPVGSRPPSWAGSRCIDCRP